MNEKITLNLEADSINMLALKMGRIAVEVAGIVLAELIDAINDNVFSLRIANEPAQLIVEGQLPGITG